MQVTTVQHRQDEEVSKIGFSENVGGVPEGWRELAENNSRSLDEMMVGRPLTMQVRDLPK